MTTTPIEKILPREALAHIKPRSAETRIADLERELARTKAELSVERTHHKTTREERDMLARQMQKMSTRHTDARIVLTMALAALKPYEEHVEARRVRKRILQMFDVPPEVDA